jgi:glyoxylase-like metal-dependent hydrolase (beta-lactamase superfamily II)
LRRHLLSFLLVAAAAPALAQGPAKPSAEPALAAPFVLHQLGPGVYAAIDGPAHKAGSNAGFVIGDDGVVVIDAFFTPEAARALVAQIRQITDKPIRYLVNTHYHLDHTGGDGALKAAGATIVAHRNVRAWLKPENPHLFGDRLTPAEQALIASLPEPDVTTTGALTLWLGSRRVEVVAYPGHTGGDLVVEVPDAKVVFCGDLFWRRTSPNIIDGTLSAWIATDSAFGRFADAAQIRFVPGHGEVGDARDVADFQAYLADLASLTRAARARRLSGDALVAAVEPAMKARWGGWAGFDYFAPKEIGFMDAELAGTKRTPRPAPEP